jgi:hypothetical protein
MPSLSSGGAEPDIVPRDQLVALRDLLVEMGKQLALGTERDSRPLPYPDRT